jgi:hypothetical protein
MSDIADIKIAVDAHLCPFPNPAQRSLYLNNITKVKCKKTWQQQQQCMTHKIFFQVAHNRCTS